MHIYLIFNYLAFIKDDWVLSLKAISKKFNLQIDPNYRLLCFSLFINIYHSLPKKN